MASGNTEPAQLGNATRYSNKNKIYASVQDYRQCVQQSRAARHISETCTKRQNQLLEFSRQAGWASQKQQKHQQEKNPAITTFERNGSQSIRYKFPRQRRRLPPRQQAGPSVPSGSRSATAAGSGTTGVSCSRRSGVCRGGMEYEGGGVREQGWRNRIPCWL